AIGSSAAVGGAIANLGGSLLVTQSTFRDDLSLGSGGAIYSTAVGGVARVEVQDSTFVNDASAQGHGGALELGGGLQATVADSTFTEDSAAFHGGAIAMLGGAGTFLALSSTTVVGNGVAADSGAGLYVAPGATALVSETIVAGNGVFGGGANGDVF